MTSALTLFVSPGTGDLYHDILNAVSSICSAGFFSSMIEVGAILGFFWVVASSIYKHTLLPSAKYATIIILLTSLILVPKVTLYIQDSSDMTSDRRVDNIPIGVGLFASAFSHIGHTLTTVFESNFSLVDDFKYQNNGILMGSRMISHVTRAKITDPEIANNMNRFIKRCIVFGIGTGHYNIRSIKESNHIWQYINDTGASSLIGVYYQDKNTKDIVACNVAMEKLNVALEQNLNDSKSFFSSRFGASNENLFDNIAAALTPGNRFALHDASKGTNILKQAMVINAMDRGFSEAGGASRNVYAESKSDIHTRMAYHATKRQAEQWLPILKTILEIIFLGAFPLVFLAMLLPEGSTVFINYLLGIFWLQTWDPIYAILNRIMHGISGAKTDAAMSLMNGDAGLALVNITEIATVNDDLIAMAGYLSLSVPFIAYAVIKGGAGSFMSLATSMLGVPQSSAISASGEASSGNISLGNTSMDTHTANTMSANKQQLSSLYDNYGVHIRNTQGMDIQETISGRTLMHENTSRLGNFNSQTMSGIQDQLSNQAMASHREAENYDKTADMHKGLAAINGLQSMYSHSSGANSNDNFAQDHSSDHIKHAQRYLSNVQSFADSNKLSADHAASLFGSIGAGIGKADYIKANGQMSLSGNASLGSVYDAAKTFSDSNNMQEGWNIGLRHAQNTSYSVHTGNQDQYMESAQQNLNTSNSMRESASQHYAQEQSASNQASHYENISRNISQDGTQAFVDWALKAKSEGGGGLTASEFSQVMSANDTHNGYFDQQHTLIDNYLKGKNNSMDNVFSNQKFRHDYDNVMSKGSNIVDEVSSTIANGSDKVWSKASNLDQSEFSDKDKKGVQKAYNKSSEDHNTKYRELKNIPTGEFLSNNINLATDVPMTNEEHNLQIDQNKDKIESAGRNISDGVGKKIEGGVSGHIADHLPNTLKSIFKGSKEIEDSKEKIDAE